MSEEASMLSELVFKRIVSSGQNGTRLGVFTLRRPDGTEIKLNTPGLMCWTSRGVVPHLTRDHVLKTDAIEWVHVPFETFLERNPPVPTLLGGENALHRFLGFDKERHILSMSLRDPFDGRELPPNGNKFINAHCIRGVRKVTPEQYRSFVLSCNPDVVTALSDIPFTPLPFSQKRITKSLERSTAWLTSLLQSLPSLHPALSPDCPHPLNIFVHMLGDRSEQARRAFADSLLETLYGKDAELTKPYKCLDDAVKGYTFDLVPLRASVLVPSVSEGAEDKVPERTPNRRTLDSKPFTRPNTDTVLPEFINLLQTSLSPLPPEKPRIVTGASSPHEVLRLISEVGIDLFDAVWAQKAADWGIALDFTFPAPTPDENTGGNGNMGAPKVREDGKRDLGHNLYSAEYAMDFNRFAASFSNGASQSSGVICRCIACSPSSPTEQLLHSSVDVLLQPHKSPTYDPPFSRAYIHHLLHTHEMSAHALLAAHNLTVAEAFFASIRALLAECGTHTHHTHDHHHESLSHHNPESGPEQTIPVESFEADFSRFSQEVDRFFEVYDVQLRLFEESKRDWIAVDYARGKGRLAREKAKLGEADLATKVEKVAEVDECSNEV